MTAYYLSGPMTGLPDLNYPAFVEAAHSIRAHGHYVYNPAEWETYSIEANRFVGTPRKFDLKAAFWDYCRVIIFEVDAVVVLPGWENSPGARAESALALAIGKPVLTYPLWPVPE